MMFVEGHGTELWDSTGKRYLDFLSGIAVTSLGHSNPVVADAIATQARTLLHVSNLFANPVATEAAIADDRRPARPASPGGQVFFCNSGAEANEAP
jgi:acetylornithine/N-succinyldiaminopimelate aminotransferase